MTPLPIFVRERSWQSPVAAGKRGNCSPAHKFWAVVKLLKNPRFVRNLLSTNVKFGANTSILWILTSKLEIIWSTQYLLCRGNLQSLSENYNFPAYFFTPRRPWQTQFVLYNNDRSNLVKCGITDRCCPW